MHILCASSDTQARTHVREVSNPLSISTQPLTHHMDEYHDNIRWAGAPCVAYPDVMLGEKNESRDVLFFFFVAVLMPFVAAPPLFIVGSRSRTRRQHHNERPRFATTNEVERRAMMMNGVERRVMTTSDIRRYRIHRDNRPRPTFAFLNGGGALPIAIAVCMAPRGAICCRTMCITAFWPIW
jgi:hypothetical protein